MLEMGLSKNQVEELNAVQYKQQFQDTSHKSEWRKSKVVIEEIGSRYLYFMFFQMGNITACLHANGNGPKRGQN